MGGLILFYLFVFTVFKFLSIKFHWHHSSISKIFFVSLKIFFIVSFVIATFKTCTILFRFLLQSMCFWFFNIASVCLITCIYSFLLLLSMISFHFYFISRFLLHPLFSQGTFFKGTCLSRHLLKRRMKIQKPKFPSLFWADYDQSIFWILHLLFMADDKIINY